MEEVFFVVFLGNLEVSPQREFSKPSTLNACERYAWKAIKMQVAEIAL